VRPPDESMLEMCRQRKYDADRASAERRDVLSAYANPREMGTDELVYAWQLLVCLSTTDRWAIDWEDETAAGVVYELAERAEKSEDFSDGDIVECIKYLSMVPRYRTRPKVLMHFSHILDVISHRRYQRDFKTCAAAAAGGCSDDYDLLRPGSKRRQYYLHLAHLWTKHKYAWGLQFTTNRLLESLIVTLLSEDGAETLSASELVYVFSLAGHLRKIPGLEKMRSDGGINLPQFLRMKIAWAMPDLSLPEVGVVAESLQKCNIRLWKGSDRVTDLILTALCSASPEDIVRHDYSVGALAKVLKHRGNIGPRDTQTLLDKYEKFLEYIHPANRIRLLDLVRYTLFKFLPLISNCCLTTFWHLLIIAFVF
jgi:hypothetical protein